MDRQTKRKLERTFDEEKKKKIKAIKDSLDWEFRNIVLDRYLRLIRRNPKKSPEVLHKQALEKTQKAYDAYMKKDYRLFWTPRKYKRLKRFHKLFIE